MVNNLLLLIDEEDKEKRRKLVLGGMDNLIKMLTAERKMIAEVKEAFTFK